MESNGLYLVVMVAITLAVAGYGAWDMLLVRCPHCGAKNVIESPKCRRCGKPMTEPGQDENEA
ncbi:MAG: zinc-ribbon domain-containing protein [Candidatus Hydrogenedens sp.]|nr:zinc-ribbon domain-containing protein [Candidatus Hydrogenedens sp.]